ncbi:MAG: alpha/beta hydrolase [Planctomycetota bacterium]
MPTPILYTEVGFDPLAHVPEDEQWIPRRVYYATDRVRNKNMQEIAYGNKVSDQVSMGLALIRFGDRALTWTELESISTKPDRDPPVELDIDGIVEAGIFPHGATPAEAAGPNMAGWLMEDMRRSIAKSRDKDVLIFVHGAKVNFYNACAFAAQLDHFMGRDMTSVAFSWPTRQDIMAYFLGGDVRRAYQSAHSLASLVELIAHSTDARRIHILSWSAGGRVAMEAMTVLRDRYPDESEETLRRRFRIGTAYFAAGDVPTKEFLKALPTINNLVDQLVITASSNDEALRAASFFMGNGGRIGQEGNDLTDEEVALIEAQDRLEVVNLSLGSEGRGFDITGHRYWFNHPWASSDVLLAIRSDLRPAQRGLEQGESPVLWSMPQDYPERLREALERTDLRTWHADDN